MMNTGQMLMVVGAIVLFGIILLGVHEVLLDSRLVSLQGRAGPLGVAIGQGRLESLAAAGYDSLTAPTFQADTVSSSLGAFVCSTWVDYVEAAAPDDTVGHPTPLKRVLIKVSNQYLNSPLALRTVVGQY